MMDSASSRSRAGAKNPEGRPPRLVFDLTTTAMWTGPPVGIVRVEREFGRFALSYLDDMVPAFFDPQTCAFRHLGREMATRLIAQDVAIDTLSFVSPARQGKRKSDRIPAVLQPLALWILQARRMALQTLERLRLGAGNARAASLADALQRAIMNEKYRAIMVKPDGSRRAYLPVDLALGPPIDLTAGDTLVCSGAGWTHNDIAAIAELKQKVGFRFVLFCYDIIPLMFPQYYKPADVETHRAYCHRALPAADLVVFSSRTIEADVRAYCAAHRLALGGTAVMALGAEIRAPAISEPLPAGLERDRYALLVSTIEPRKGHRLISDAWLELLQAGIPQRVRFKLVFAGRVGWMIGDLMRDLRDDPRVAGTIEIVTDADDAKIAALYRNAAFCLYPSRYEGYGLPAVEAFHYGKAVLASTGGAVPEVVGNLSPCLDPEDGEAWRGMLQSWIEDPAARAGYEERIRTSFRHPDWDESARTFFALVRGAGVER
jgi:glycosyltransferase involved in cell wall biosynthesis